MRYAGVAAIMLASACSTPAADEILSAGSIVPDAYADVAVHQQVDGADGLEGTVPRTTGFAHGEQIHYWTLGTVSSRTMNGYELCRPSGATCARIAGVPPVIDAIPGDAAYSPFVRIHRVPVTAAYNDEILPSSRAIAQAQSRGLVGAPVDTSRYTQLFVVDDDVRLEAGPSFAPIAPTDVYYRGMRVRAFDFTAADGLLALDGEAVLVRNVYVLTRDGDPGPLSEAMRGMDLTGDGDLGDSNSILGAATGDADYTPLWRPVLVTVPASYASIDTSMDEAVADYKASTDMFTIDSLYQITPIPGAVVSFTLADSLVDCPMQSVPGGL